MRAADRGKPHRRQRNTTFPMFIRQKGKETCSCQRPCPFLCIAVSTACTNDPGQKKPACRDDPVPRVQTIRIPRVQTMHRPVAGLPAAMGGLGLCSASRVSPAAYWAGWADALTVIQTRRAGFAEARVAELSSPAHGPGPPSLREAEAARAQLQAEGWTTVPSWQDLLEGARPQHNDQAVGLGDWPHGWQFHASRIRHSHFRDRVLLPSLPPSLRALLRSQAGAQAGAWLTAMMCLPHCRQVPCRLRCGAGCGSRCPSLPTDAGVRGPAAEASLTLSGIMPLLARGLVCSLGARRLSSGPGCGSRAKLWAQKVRWCRSSGSPTPRPLESTRGTDAAWTWPSTVFPRGGRHSAATPRLCRR